MVVFHLSKMVRVDELPTVESSLYPRVAVYCLEISSGIKLQNFLSKNTPELRLDSQFAYVSQIGNTWSLDRKEK